MQWECVWHVEEICLVIMASSQHCLLLTLLCCCRYNIGTTVSLADQFQSVSISADMQVRQNSRA